MKRSACFVASRTWRLRPNWSIGLPWRDLRGIRCCRCNIPEAESVHSGPASQVWARESWSIGVMG